MKHNIILNQNTELSGKVFPAGTVIGSVTTEHEPRIVANMLLYNQVSLVDADVENDAVVSQAVHSGSEQEKGGDLSTVEPIVPEVNPEPVPDVNTVEQVKSDLYSLALSESVIETLIEGGVTSIAELNSYIDSGKDLGDIRRIGSSRIRDIMEALGRSQPAPVVTQPTDL